MQSGHFNSSNIYELTPRSANLKDGLTVNKESQLFLCCNNSLIKYFYFSRLLYAILFMKEADGRYLLKMV